RQSPGLTRLVLTRAEEEFYGWVSVQKHLDEGYSEILKNLPFQSELYGGERSSRTIQQNLEGKMKPFPKHGIHFIEMDHIVRFTDPLYLPNDPTAMIVYPSERKSLGLAHGIHSLSRSNILRALTRLLFRGYSTQKNFMEGISEEELQDFYFDNRELGTDLEVFDPRNSNVGERAFMEGNLFTGHSDGMNNTVREVLEMPSHFVALPEPNEKPAKVRRRVSAIQRRKMRAEKERQERKLDSMDRSYGKANKKGPLESIADIYERPNRRLLSFKETLDLIAYMYSGGILRDRMYKFFVGKCGVAISREGTVVVDYSKIPKIERSCVERYFIEGTDLFFIGMPNMIKYLKKRTGPAQNEIVNVFIETSKRFDEPNEYIEQSELAFLAMIAQYSEALMVRFDTNENQIISNEEIWTYVYPVFRGFIHKMALEKYSRNLTDEGDVRSTFAFIVDHGKLPEGNFDLIKIWLNSLFHFDDSMNWDLSMDRGDIIKVFSAVVRASRDTDPKESSKEHLNAKTYEPDEVIYGP
ncbi:MAG: hypothetical protein KDD61_09565, partial [Bdellovibrionales bacterium]|nr:hypothetical protein [Bdellovibrionales bacterium]